MGEVADNYRNSLRQGERKPPQVAGPGSPEIDPPATRKDVFGPAEVEYWLVHRPGGQRLVGEPGRPDIRGAWATVCPGRLLPSPPPLPSRPGFPGANTTPDAGRKVSKAFLPCCKDRGAKLKGKPTLHVFFVL